MTARYFFFVLVVACGKKTPAPPTEIEASPPPLVLEPMETPNPTSPVSDAMAQADVEIPQATDRPEPGGAHTYKDKWDLPADAGLLRCPNPPSAQTASVRLEMIMFPKRTIDLVIPSLGVRKRLWKPAPGPSSCYSAITEKEDGLQFVCRTDEGSVAGKVYGRASDVVLGENGMSGQTVERFMLPCGTRPRFEKIACPGACERDRNSNFPKNECGCPDSAGELPVPASTTKPR